MERNKTRRKSIDEESKNIWRGPIAPLVVPKKNNFKKQLHRNIEEKRLFNLPSKNNWLPLSKAFNISILEPSLYHYRYQYNLPRGYLAWGPQILETSFSSISLLGDASGLIK